MRFIIGRFYIKGIFFLKGVIKFVIGCFSLKGVMRFVKKRRDPKIGTIGKVIGVKIGVCQ